MHIFTFQKVAEPKKVEITVGSAENASVTAAAGEQKQDNLSQLTSEIMGALCFDLSGKTDEELRTHNSQLQSLLGKASSITIQQFISTVCYQIIVYSLDE